MIRLAVWGATLIFLRLRGLVNMVLNVHRNHEAY